MLSNIAELVAIVGSNEIPSERPGTIATLMNEVRVSREADLPTFVPKRATEIDVFVPGRKESFVETARAHEGVAAEKQSGGSGLFDQLGTHDANRKTTVLSNDGPRRREISRKVLVVDVTADSTGA